MAKNVSPIFCGDPDNQWLSMINVTANTASDGTGTVGQLYLAPVDGSLLLFIKAVPISHTGNNNVANVARIFLNNGSTNATASNNSFFEDLALPATTGIAAGSLPKLILPMNLPMKAGHRINITLGTTTGAGLGWYFTAIAGSFLIN